MPERDENISMRNMFMVRAVLNPSKSDLNGTVAWEETNQANSPADQPLRRDEELEGTETEI